MDPKHSVTHAMPKAQCAVPWSEMAGDERVRTCPLCDEKVYNPQFYNASELLSLADNPNIKTSLFRRSDGKIMLAPGKCGDINQKKAVLQLAADVMITCIPIFMANVQFAYLFAAVLVAPDVILEYSGRKMGAGKLLLIRLAIVWYLSTIGPLSIGVVQMWYCAIMPIFVVLHFWYAQRYGVQNYLLEARNDEAKKLAKGD
jgi:hypothetical protein